MARTITPAKEPRINIPLKRSLRNALNKQAKAENRRPAEVVSDLLAERFGKPRLTGAKEALGG